MKEAMRTILSASESDRRSLYEDVAKRMRSQAGSIEKDLWVCWTLDWLFNERTKTDPVAMIFKGGTSLSKCFGLIDRFSEDIDLTLSKADIGAPSYQDIRDTPADRSKSRRIDREIIPKSSEYVTGPLQEGLRAAIDALSASVGLPSDALRIEYGTTTTLKHGKEVKEVDYQTLMLHYPTVVDDPDGYVKNVVKIECGARADPSPETVGQATPYLASHLPALAGGMEVRNINATRPERTFWEKVHILHGLRRKFEERAQSPSRPTLDKISRHYYDVHRIWRHPDYGIRVATDQVLARTCADHKALFFPSKDERMDLARPGSYSLSPSPEMMKGLGVDYAKMTGMIFGDPPAFDLVMQDIRELEAFVNFGPKHDLDAEAEEDRYVPFGP